VAHSVFSGLAKFGLAHASEIPLNVPPYTNHFVDVFSVFIYLNILDFFDAYLLNPTPLMVENSVSGGEVKAVDEGKSSATPVTEKWLHEAATCKKGKTESSGEFGGESGI
jgi:hypothetical protein